jgi:hypothetical protein
MFIYRNRLNQLNKDLFGGGINQSKKLVPDYERVIMPDPSLPKIKRFRISSNNPLGYIMNQNQPIIRRSQTQIQKQNIPPPQNIQPEPEEYSQKISEGKSQEVEEINHNIIQEQISEKQQIQEELQEKKYKITDLGENNVLLPPGYSTDDEGEYKLINLINEPKEHYKFATESEYSKVYKRIVSHIFKIIITLIG